MVNTSAITAPQRGLDKARAEAAGSEKGDVGAHGLLVAWEDSGNPAMASPNQPRRTA